MARKCDAILAAPDAIATIPGRDVARIAWSVIYLHVFKLFRGTGRGMPGGTFFSISTDQAHQRCHDTVRIVCVIAMRHRIRNRCIAAMDCGAKRSVSAAALRISSFVNAHGDEMPALLKFSNNTIDGCRHGIPSAVRQISLQPPQNRRNHIAF